MKKIKHTIIITVLAMFFCIQAAAGTFAPSLAQLLRINTGAEISVVLASDEADVKDKNIVSVRNIDGGVLYEKVGELVLEGGDAYPYLSGVNVSFEVSDSAGVRKVKLTGMTTEEGKLDMKKTYMVALSQAADVYFEDCEKVASYSADNGLLYNYVNGFAPYDESGGESTENEGAAPTEPAGGDADGKDVMAKQGDMLILTVTIFAIVLVIYLFIRKKKKQQ